MKLMKNIFLAGCAILLLSQCATRDDVRQLNHQIRAVNLKVDNVKTSTVTQIQRRQAASVSQLDQVSGEVVRLESLIIESNHRDNLEQHQLSEQIMLLQTSLEEHIGVNEQNITGLQQQIQQLSAGVDNIHRARIQMAEQQAIEAAKRAEQARQRTVMAVGRATGFVNLTPDGEKVRIGTGRVAVVGTIEQVAQLSPVVPAQRIPVATDPMLRDAADPVALSSPFEQAMNKFNNQQYQEAYLKLEHILVDNPRGKVAAQVLFYMGESLFRQGEYDLAILDYQKVISNHPQDPHTPAALLKQGMSFEKLNDYETARIIYRKLIKDHPGTAEADKARARQAQL